MLELGLPWWEFVLRAAVVYVFLLFMMRLTGKRQAGQLAPFDLVLLLVLSNAVQNSMNGGDESLLGGIILATTLLGLNYALAFLTLRSKKLEAAIEGRPRILVHNGRVFRDVLEEEMISKTELRAALRQAGCLDVRRVHVAVLEDNGAISVIVRDKDERPAQAPHQALPM